MSEYIVDFFGIGARLTERFGFCVPFVRALDKERKEPIVRCRDCEFGREEGVENECWFCVSDRWNMLPTTGVPVEPDGFCAWGERKQP